MNGHTEPPWFVESGSLRVLSEDKRATIVCDVSGSPANPQAVADAMLIAAAPDLLSALQELSDWVERAIVPGYSERKPIPENCRKALDSSRSAISKAKGDRP